MISRHQAAASAAVGNWIDAYFPRCLLDGLSVTFYFGGTSLLIVVGVAMDTVNQIEAQLIMRHYEGFTPRAGRIRGRRSSVLIVECEAPPRLRIEQLTAADGGTGSDCAD